MRVFVITVCVLLFSLLLIACEYPGVRHPLAGSVNVPSHKTPSVTPAPDPDPVNTTGPACQKCDVKLIDFKLDPINLSAKAGSITFVLKNEGRVTHAFQVEGNGISVKAPNVGQGKTIEWTIPLPPGAYIMSCRISNHAERGMKGTLTVSP